MRTLRSREVKQHPKVTQQSRAGAGLVLAAASCPIRMVMMLPVEQPLSRSDWTLGTVQAGA